MFGPSRGFASRLSACALALVLPFATPGLARAQLVLGDPAPQTFSYSTLRHGDDVVVCDDGAQTVRHLNVRLLRFALRQESRPLPLRTALTTGLRTRTLATGACALVRIALRPGVTLDPGNYPGLLDVVSSAGVVRVALTIGGPAASADVTPADGAGATISLTATRDGFLAGDAHLDGGGLLPVRVVRSGAAPALPAVNHLMGTLFRGAQSAHVFRAAGVAQQDPDDPDLWLVPVRVAGLGKTGTYHGRLTLSSAVAGDPPVPVSVTVSDTWVYPVLVVVLGALTAFVAQLWIRNWRVARRWDRRLRRLGRLYAEANEAFGPPYPRRDVAGPTRAIVDDYVKRIRDAIKQSSSWIAFFDSSSPAYKGIVGSLSGAEDDAFCLKSSLDRRLSVLGDMADDTLLLLAKECPSDRTPACVTRAARLLGAGTLNVGSAKGLAARADQQARYLEDWRGLLESALRYDGWRRRLAVMPTRARKGPSSGSITTADRRLLEAATAALRTAEFDLFEAPDAASLDHRGTVARLDRVRDDLCLLREVYESRIPAGSVPPPRDAPLLGGDAVPAADGVELATLIEQVDPVTVRDAEPVRVRDTLRTLGDVLALAFSIAIGVLATLVILYFGKTFGSLEDYLTAFAAGATSQLLVSGLIATLGQMQASDRDAVTVIDPKPAAVEG
jgi:hypothetical protein